MHKNEDIVKNVLSLTMYGGLDWKILSINTPYTIEGRIIGKSTKYVSRKKISPKKYLTFILTVNFIGSTTIDFNNMILSIQLTTSKDTVKIKQIISGYEATVIDIYDVMSYGY